MPLNWWSIRTLHSRHTCELPIRGDPSSCRTAGAGHCQRNVSRAPRGGRELRRVQNHDRQQGECRHRAKRVNERAPAASASRVKSNSVAAKATLANRRSGPRTTFKACSTETLASFRRCGDIPAPSMRGLQSGVHVQSVHFLKSLHGTPPSRHCPGPFTCAAAKFAAAVPDCSYREPRSLLDPGDTLLTFLLIKLTRRRSIIRERSLPAPPGVSSQVTACTIY